MIVEFESDPVEWPQGMEWNGRRAVDMCWVASISPWRFSKTVTGTSMLMCGSQAWFTVSMPYSDVMTLWLKAKGLEAINASSVIVIGGHPAT